MLEADVVELLESGCALVVGFVTLDGAPYATRGWGLTLLEEARTARLLVGTADLAALGHRQGGLLGTMIATTGANVLTLRSAQLKGPIIAVESAGHDDHRRMSRYCDAFFSDVALVDDIPRRLMERLVPEEVSVCTFTITEWYDQTPGPNAGKPLRTAP
jgi:hypothetical protein